MEIQLEKIIAGGDALGRLEDGRAVFVPFGAPGERVRVEVAKEEKGFLRARLVEVLEPSVERVVPRCWHFGDCGGCQLQHLRYEAQLAAKKAVLIEQLTRLGGLKDPPVGEPVPSPAQWNYRNHVQFAVSARGELGFHQIGTGAFLPVTECHLPEGRLWDLRASLDLRPFPGLEQVGLRAADEGEMIVFESESGEAPQVECEAAVSIAVCAPGGEATYLAGGPLSYQINGRTFTVSAGSFFQVNTRLIPAMVKAVLDLAAPGPRETALDLYSGTGLFSAFLAEKAGRLIGVEQSPAAVADFERNLDSFDNVELYAAPAEDALGAIAAKVDLAVADPPRAGLAPRALEALARLTPRRLVMISCEPATLARDGRALAAASYRLESVTPLDLFPQTCHLESVSLWIKE